MKYTNREMEQMLGSLKPILPQRNKAGYVAARNTRILRDALTEYFVFKNRLIEKYGEHDIDKNGNQLPTVSVKYGLPGFDEFLKEYMQIGDIEQDISITTLGYDEVEGVLSGEEILAVEWMLEDI